MTQNWMISVWRVGIALLIGMVGELLLRFGLNQFEKSLIKSKARKDRRDRLNTLLHAGRSIGRILILLVVLLMILHELGINITPILASAGVVGLAFSLGSQTFIKDFIGGVIILSENQFAIGDVITVGQISGTVEHITLRATYLRDIYGGLNIVPNGDIRSITNLTSHWAQVVITFNFPPDVNMDSALAALRKATGSLESDKEISPLLMEPASILGWTKFTDWSIQTQVIMKTKSGKQWTVERELRKKALDELTKAGIKLAFLSPGFPSNHP